MDRGSLGSSDALLQGIVDVPGYPRPGIVFKDITPLLADHTVSVRLVAALGEPFRGKVDKVAGIEARGFILAAPVAHLLGVGFVPVRKAGKLPRATFSEDYDLEYGQATLEVHRDAFEPGERVLVVDDVLATGGTAAAALRLVARANGVPAGFTALLDLGLGPAREKLAGTPLHILHTVAS